MALIYFIAVWALSGFVTGIASFGSNLFAVPLIALVWEPREAILVGCVAAFSIFIELAFIYRKQIFWKDTIALSLGSLGGIPFGIWFLGAVGSAGLLLAAGASIIIFLAWQFVIQFLGKALKAISSTWAIPFGFFSGILMGAIGMGGPPLVLYIFLRLYNKKETLGTLNAASVVIMLLVLCWQYSSGLYSAQILKLGALGGAAAFVGILGSIPLARHINIGIFRKLLLGMLALSAATLFVRAFLETTGG